MSSKVDKLVSEIRSLPNEDKIRVLDALLTDLHQPDPKIKAMWALEARRRWQAYKRGELGSISYEELMSKYKQ
ncbi:MAG TPA: addiction module protein [Pyrinomonadaceae bacterium]|nr:addiction module protein [Pyrinomonadaceae bacterium]